MQIADLGKQHLVPAATRGIAGVVEVTLVACLGVADDGDPLGQDRGILLAHLGHELGQGITGRAENLGDRFGAGPALLALLHDSLALVEGGRIKTRSPRQSRGGHAVLFGQAVDGPPNICVLQHMHHVLN